jgi:anti-sigma B factor antagonist
MPDAPFEIEQDGHVVTAKLRSPDISYAEMAEACQTCVEKLRFDNARCFVFDMTEVEFLASACIGAMVELMREVEPMRGKIALANCKENVVFLFKVTKLDDIFGLFDDIDDAIEAMSEDLR